ncbi:MAG: response regulator [Bacteroidales bacterium]|nr:response regulator [Bacteroidales bacterium]
MRSKLFGEKHLKTKVFLSYALIILLISSIVYFTISSFQQLTQSSDELAKPNARIELLHDILFTIYNAESNIRSYTLSEQEETLNAYFLELSNINDMVDSLLILAGSDRYFLRMIDSVNIKLNEKTELLEQFIELKRQDENSIFYQRALHEILQIAEGEGKLREITHQSIFDPEFNDSISEGYLEEVSEERESAFRRLWKSITGRDDKKDKEQEQVAEENEFTAIETDDSQIAQQVRTDSIITVYRDTDDLRGDIESTLRSIAQSMVRKQQRLKAEENRILKEDKEVMDRIWGYVKLLEDYERANAVEKAQTAHYTVRSTTNKIFYIVIFSLFVLIVFSMFLVSDINKSRFYKNQLVHAKNRAEDLLLVKQRFMANISHEIRTPLNSIIGFSRQLGKIDLKKEHKTFVNAINQSSVHLLNMVNDILDFSKIEAGKIHLEDIYLNIKEIAKEVHNTLHIIATEKKIDFKIDTRSLKNHDVSGDPIRIRQILLNIAGNAIKFTEKGSVEMVLSDYVKEENPEISYVSIRITDTGVGIAPADQEKIFEEFAQSDNQVSRKFGGTGLGLSISKKLVEIMNGSIELISSKGKGTTFTIHLPLKIAEKPAEQVIKEPEKTDEKLTAKILLVEDDKLNRLLLKSVFNDYPGIHLLEAEDALKGLELIKKEKFDLIITDIQMPGMSGIEMVRQMKQIPDVVNFKTPVLAFTADITPENIVEIEQNGIDDYITKPVDENQLLNKISELLNANKRATYTDLTDPKQIDHRDPDSDRSVSSPGNKLYDLEGLKRFTGNDEKSMILIIEAFLDDTKKHIKELEAGLEDDNRHGIFQIAHKMSNMFDILIVNGATDNLKNLSRIMDNNITEKEIAENVNRVIDVSKELVKSLKSDLEELVERSA